ncbi:ISAs1 family transposase, partial [Acaryochloris marina NIES-2412]
ILLRTDEERFAQCLSRFFEIVPQPGETVATDGKVLKHSFMFETDNPSCQTHPAIMMVTGYLVERGLILP